MQCPECCTVNPGFHRFCHACGASLQREPSGDGAVAGKAADPAPAGGKTVSASRSGSSPFVVGRGERKTVTVMFCDLSGYTAMSETLDPEDVKDIMTGIFGMIAETVSKYGGTVLKLIGDAALVAFGIPRAHEDDPVRAIHTALDIHANIEKLNPRYEIRIGSPLAMHTGINTGLVVIETAGPDRRWPEITGDAVNVASRLEGLSKAGEILVGRDTYLQARRFFRFEPLPSAQIKGKSAPMPIYRAKSPLTIRVQNAGDTRRRAALVGREAEVGRLERIFETLIQEKKGSLVVIVGEAGTGKSRLLQECRIRLQAGRVRWLWANAHAFAQKNSYALFTDLLLRFLKIDEGYAAEDVMRTLNAEFESLGLNPDAQAFMAELLSVARIRLEALDPESRKSALFGAIEQFIRAVAARQPTVVCLEDLHWVDPSSAELIRHLLSGPPWPCIILLVLRPSTVSILPDSMRNRPGAFQRIDLKELTGEQMLAMAASLLQTDRIPAEMQRFIQFKTDGNPFYLEEVVHSLIETQRLVRDQSGWHLNGMLRAGDMPLTIQGVIAGRLDRLNHDLKRILQEASVIGRIFYYDILKSISKYAGRLDNCLNRLQLRDLIQISTRDNEIEYLFKHALIQEVVYNGLLKKERRVIHGKIARAMETIFCDRLSEYHEALALHYSLAHNKNKSVEYLIKAGDKSLKRYALEESHRHFQNAHRLLTENEADPGDDAKCLLIDLINRWSFVFYYRGRYRELLQLLREHEAVAEGIRDDGRLGMLRAWLGCALWHRERFTEAYACLNDALALGQTVGSPRINGYAGCWLAWVCTELGMMDEAIACADRACRIYRTHALDPYIYVNALAGKGYALWHSGQKERLRSVAMELLAFGRAKADKRARLMGHCCVGWEQLLDGSLERASIHFEKAQALSSDPWYGTFPGLALCYGYISNGRHRAAEALVERIIEFSRERGAEFAGSPARFFQGVLLAAEGRLQEGVRRLEEKLAHWEKSGCRLRYAVCGPILAAIYAGIGRPGGFNGKAAFGANLGFMVRKAPLAARRASGYFRTFTAAALDIGAVATAGRAYLNWGRLYRSKNRPERARDCFEKAVACFETCGIRGYFEQAKQELDALDDNA